MLVQNATVFSQLIIKRYEVKSNQSITVPIEKGKKENMQ